MYVCTCIYVIIAIIELHCSKHANKLPQLILIKKIEDIRGHCLYLHQKTRWLQKDKSRHTFPISPSQYN